MGPLLAWIFCLLPRQSTAEVKGDQGVSAVSRVALRWERSVLEGITSPCADLLDFEDFFPGENGAFRATSCIFEGRGD